MIVHKAIRIDPDLYETLHESKRHGAITDALRLVTSELAAGTRTLTPPKKVSKQKPRIGALLDEDDLKKVADLAAAHNMSFDAFINVALRNFVEESSLHDK